MYLVNRYRAAFKKIHIGYLALVAVLVASGVFGACPYIYGIQQEDFMDFKVTVFPNSSLAKGSRGDWVNLTIKDGTNMVIVIGRVSPGNPRTTAIRTSVGIWLETSQEGLEISEKEITITEWSRACVRIIGRYIYFSSNGSGVLKIRKQNNKLLSGGQETSFHGTARFHFTDPSVERMKLNAPRNINWTFLLNEPEGALLFSIKESN